jgi:membrane associated rhomboid family serine protease
MSVIPFKKRFLPYVNFNAVYYIMGATVLVFILGIFRPSFLEFLALNEIYLMQGHIWQLFSYSLVESTAGIWNMAFNMLALFFFGTQVENEMGSSEFLIFYLGMSLINGLLGIITLHFLGAIGFPIFGSSGLVSGVMLAFASLYPESTIYVFGLIPVRAPVLMLVTMGFLVLNLVLSGPIALVQMYALLVSFIFMLVRYRRNMFSSLFRK